MKAQKIVSELIDWANNAVNNFTKWEDKYTGMTPDVSGYRRGYRDGLLAAEGTIELIVEKHELDANEVYVVQINHGDNDRENIGIFSTIEKANKIAAKYAHLKVDIIPVALDKLVAF